MLWLALLVFCWHSGCGASSNILHIWARFDGGCDSSCDEILAECLHCMLPLSGSWGCCTAADGISALCPGGKWNVANMQLCEGFGSGRVALCAEHCCTLVYLAWTCSDRLYTHIHLYCWKEQQHSLQSCQML